MEILIATVMLVPIALGLAMYFRSSTSAVQSTKDQTSATFFASSQMEYLKALPYHRVLVASTTAPIPNLPVDPKNRYDPVHYPEESQTVGAVTFRRYIFIEKVQRGAGDVFTVVPATGPETNMKRVNQTVAWQSANNQKVMHFSNYINKLQTDENRGQYFLSGLVVDTNSLPIAGAIVQDNYAPQFAARTNASGTYQILFDKERQNTQIGISSLPYATQLFTKSVGPAVPLATQNATLVRYPVSDITITAWRSTHPVIATVVGKVLDPSNGNFPVEYVEILNPTTNYITVAGRLGLRYQRALGGNNGQDPGYYPIDIHYNAAGIGYKQYYLFANTTTFQVNFWPVTADAVWVGTSTDNQTNFGSGNRRVGSSVFTAANPNVITVYGDDSGVGAGDQHEGAGSLQLYDLVTNEVYDTVGWKGGGGTPVSPGMVEGAPFDGPVEGLRENYVFHRFVSTEGFAGTNWVMGPSYRNCHAYETDNNSVNWGEQPLNFPAIWPRTSANVGTCFMRSGIPWPGTDLWFQDRFFNTSTYTAVLVTPANGRAYAGVTIPGDAEPTLYLTKWAYGSKDGLWGWLAMEQGASVTPIPPAFQNPYVVLDKPNNLDPAHLRGPRWITGKVLNQNGMPFTGVIYVASQFDYYPPGYFSFPNQANPQTGEYRYFVSYGLNGGVNLWPWQGAITNGGWNSAPYILHPNYNLNLSGPAEYYPNVNLTAYEGGGRIRGFVTSDGVTPVAGIQVRIANTSAGGTKTAFSGDDGVFSSDFMSTGTFSVTPQMSAGEICVPASTTVLATAVTTYFSSTFTYGTPYGTIAGTVSDALQANGSGATLVVSTYPTAAVTLFTLDAAQRGSTLRFFSAVSDDQGRYVVRVREGTNYFVHCFHTRIVNNTPMVSSATAGPFAVTMGSAQNGVDFAW